MVSPLQTNYRVRHSFGKIERIVEVPNLIAIQKRSYDAFLQATVSPDEREDIGLQAVFKSVFPIRDFNGRSELVFAGYTLERPDYDVEECRQRGMTYAAPMKVTIQLIIYDSAGDGGDRVVRDIKEQEVYFGKIPLMTESGTFVVNGTERVVVSQLHRSPGVFFDHDRGKTHASGKLLYQARVIPYRGSWLDFEFDPKDILYVRIDRRRKLPATVLLKALGYSTKDLLDYFYDQETLFLEGEHTFYRSIDFKLLAGQRATRDIEVDGEIVVKKNRKFNRAAIRKLEASNVARLPLERSELIGKVAAADVVDEETGEVVLSVNEELTETKLNVLLAAGIKEVRVLFIDGLNVGSYLRDTLLVDKVASADDAIIEIYRRLRPGDPPTIDTARQLFQNLFFNPERYDLSRVGRLKLNYKFYENREEERPDIETTVLTHQDILHTVRHLVQLRNGVGSVDDIDHLGNRRVRAVGELMENQYRIGLVRMERAVKERMSMSQELETLMPHDLINDKPVSAVVKEYFGSSQLSQFMDQTNPLSEVTHKRRLSALGPGGLTRERAGFEVRDVHATHYGRICPIETPEGQNIGLIASLSTHARVNEYGFVETPYRKVVEGKVTTEVRWFSALEEEGHYIAQANASVSKEKQLEGHFVSARYNGEFVMVPPENISLMDVSPNQLVSVAASLIPFLEHDDANRALMGSNMQRQAVPLLRSHAPLVGTGLEAKVARDSGVCILAKRDGVVVSVDAMRIVVKSEAETGVFPDVYRLNKFQRSNQSTAYTQKPIVRAGDRVQVGDVIADGPSCDTGELSLGQNVVVAFMPWGGYNFEDSILLSERIAKDDVYTSIHIEEFECVARNTKLGKEEITRDIPNVGDEMLKDLDDSGIIRIGAEVQAGDILVGKITPKGETQLSPEEKLLRAIFGEKAGDVRDTSLRVPPGVGGVVINARVFSRNASERDGRAKEIDDFERAKLEKDMADEVKILRESAYGRVRSLLIGQKAEGRLVDDRGQVLLEAGVDITATALDPIPRKYWGYIEVVNQKTVVEDILLQLTEQTNAVESLFQEKINKISQGDQLAPGVLKMVKVYMAVKRKLQVGDKMAGRHGNKGVVSRILPEEDMPFLPDGTPVDVALNPLGVPSRMNVGQILESHLGWAGYQLGKRLQEAGLHGVDALRTQLSGIFERGPVAEELRNLSDEEVVAFAKKFERGVPFATPVFDGANENEIRRLLALAGVETHGQTVLFDGRTGEAFHRDVTVGIMYVLKLHHLIDDKIHARSIGPYSLVTQQPLGGKAQFGGQRLGEMEVWAMEAYGAAYALQEFLTVKSDDVQGRTRIYESIVKGEHRLEAGIPESFNVLMRELQALCLNIEMIDSQRLQGSSAGVFAAE